ncbi:MAG: YfhO family protein [Oscillospiraceae bacterium]|jgi:uncharacterized membrane protein YfhO|nr:YfhO family protein [Oscillospiraceae bacterium]
MKKEISPLRKVRKGLTSPILLSFLLPFVIVSAVFAIGGLWPFGSYQIMTSDSWHQYYPFFVSFREKLLSGGSLQHTWTVGLGTGYAALFAYYLASPLYLLSVFVPAAYLREFFALTIIIKIACGGMFFAVFVRTVFKRCDLSVIFFSLMYALCAFVSGYYWNCIWLDTFALLPLLVAGTVSLLRDGKFRLYILALALSVWCNYYLSFFSCIFVLLCFLGYTICCWNGFKGLWRRFLRIGVCTVIAFGITAVLLLPTLKAMGNTYSISGQAPNLLAMNINYSYGNIPKSMSTAKYLYTETLPKALKSAWQVVANLLADTKPNKMGGLLPNVFSSFTAVILGLFYLCCKKIKKREKFVSVGLLAFFVLSFIFRTLDFYWHGMHFPNMIPFRQSYLFSFVLITMAYRAYTLIDDFKKRYLFFIVPPCLALIGCGYYFEASIGKRSLVLNCAVLGGVVTALLLHSKSKRWRKNLSLALLALIITCEMSLGFALDTGFTYRADYPKNSEEVQMFLSEIDTREEGALFWRTEMNTTQSLNDAALNEYNGVSLFSSAAIVATTRIMRAFGLSAWPTSNRYAYYESSPLTNTLLGIKYIINRNNGQLTADYTETIATAGDSTLRENTAYIAPGFMTNIALGGFVSKASTANPLTDQEEMFRLATGILDPLYTHFIYSSYEAEENTTLTPSGTSGKQFSFSTTSASGKSDLSISYIVPQSGLVCATTFGRGADEVKIYRNGEYLFTCNIKARGLFILGNCAAGDEITLTHVTVANATGAIIADLAVLNNDVFDRGMEILSRDKWTLSEFSDTHVKGTIAVTQDGLFYSSFAYQDGWRVYVDGEEIAVCTGANPKDGDVKLTDTMICFPLSAGTHEIELRYTAPGLIPGAIISILCLDIFVVLCLLLRKKKRLFPDPPAPGKPYVEPSVAIAPYVDPLYEEIYIDQSEEEADSMQLDDAQEDAVPLDETENQPL